jgi:hypothetical protein
MREYVVQAGDTPGSIAAMYAGCPKCSRDLLAVNKKPRVRHPNGYETFRELRVGEKLNLPDKWFNGALDALPKAYFLALPNHDGRTPGVGSPNVLDDYAILDAAAAQVGALAALGDQPFNYAVEVAATAVDAAVQQIGEGTTVPTVYAAPYAQEVRKYTALARQRNAELKAAIVAGDDQAAFKVRSDILHDLSSALTSAQLALQAFYGDAGAPPETPPPPQVDVTIGPATIDPVPVLPAAVAAAAQAAANAIGADANYCASVAQVGSAVNATVHVFKLAWNAANPSNPVPVGTSTYEQATADAITKVIGHAPVACGGAKVAPPPSPPAPVPAPLVVPQAPAPGIGVAGVLGLGLLGAGAVSSAIYFATRAPVRRVRRVNAHRRHQKDLSK